MTTDVGERDALRVRRAAFAEAGAARGHHRRDRRARRRLGRARRARARAARKFAPDEADFLARGGQRDLQRGRSQPRRRGGPPPRDARPAHRLPNRALALDRLEGALARRRRDGRAVAVLLADLDQFKLVNDSMGHRAGDDLLVALAPRLHDAVRPSDTVARLGGDEFLVVCEQLDGAHEAIRVAERVAQAINQPIVLGGRRALHHREHRDRGRRERRRRSRPTCCATPTPRCTARRSAAAAATSCSTTCCASAC